MRYLWVIFFIFCVLVGEYKPQKDKFGNLLSRQCWGSTGLCWCEYSVKKEYFRMSDTRVCPSKN